MTTGAMGLAAYSTVKEHIIPKRIRKEMEEKIQNIKVLNNIVAMSFSLMRHTFHKTIANPINEEDKARLLIVYRQAVIAKLKWCTQRL